MDRMERFVQQFKANLELKMNECRELIEEYSARGGCALWGAATKGAMLLNHLDPEAKFVRYVIDLNPAKHGKFIPGTGHAIVPPSHLTVSPVAGILLMNPNYLDENMRLLRQLGVTTPLECV